ncbi:protein-L-isoaspartate(D-aspartate) O-methyltransferase [uncultured Eudoraea sp.]|uniref:protein-L-isoaspartate(D-aspartate) O-methyltransferase n=1 Tax=uncultured Eudoraea sp. TaxID=1035614 RepID=UPI0026251645|nr:protein-L-isoaspartate(D-aspartate) O-methyltransferase [uncultured Eudoraea sp.]
MRTLLKHGSGIKLVLAGIISLLTAFAYSQIDHKQLRENMIKEQLLARDISDPATIKAMRNVPRHEFVPPDMQPYAYVDNALPIGMKQTISQPYIVAYMTQVLKLKEHDRVLEVGTGSGYQAAILGQIVDTVYTIEIVEALAFTAKNRLLSLGYGNIVVKTGDGYLGWPEKGPFNAIMVTAGAEEVPEPLLKQLKEGGRMIIPVGPHNGIRQLLLITKKSGKIKTKEVMAVRFVPLTRTNN